MIIEASHTYFGGGYVLLEQILDYCETNRIATEVYVGYRDVFEKIRARNYRQVRLVKTNSISTLFRYFRKRSNVLFFCNLPPFVRNEQSVLYAQNYLLFETPRFTSQITLVYNIKKFVYFHLIKNFSHNVSDVVCQTVPVQQILQKNLGINARVYPFFRDMHQLELTKRYDFCNIGSGEPHKNLGRLLDAVESLSARYTFTLVVTLDGRLAHRELQNRIERINNKFQRTVITNLGHIHYEHIIHVYHSSRAMVFPSLAETIALPLIEAQQCGITVISSDLPYTHNVLTNPITFDPEDVGSIEEKMEGFLLDKYSHVSQELKVQSKLDDFIHILL
ncbi:MAG: glycosyltransferase [Bacteroidales bacterium]|jgi:glycosyltransferase involved in cell wall biosynthesis|nr:glycosyltransferase [Bacteroidales bacterium]